MRSAAACARTGGASLCQWLFSERPDGKSQGAGTSPPSRLLDLPHADQARRAVAAVLGVRGIEGDGFLVVEEGIVEAALLQTERQRPVSLVCLGAPPTRVGRRDEERIRAP